MEDGRRLSLRGANRFTVDDGAMAVKKRRIAGVLDVRRQVLGDQCDSETVTRGIRRKSETRRAIACTLYRV